MNWDERLIGERELRAYQEDETDQSLDARVAALIDQQIENWPLLRDGTMVPVGGASRRRDICPGTGVVHNCRSAL